MIAMSLRTLAALLLSFVPPLAFGAAVDGELRQWHPVTLTFEGPETSEQATPNPFRDFRLDVAFTHSESGETLTVPGFYAADGDAAETSSAAGNKWRVRFLPSRPGEWRYHASFRMGTDVALNDDPRAGAPTAFDGDGGSFTVAAPENPDEPGLLEYVGGHYLRYAGSGQYFLKGGADSPENFLAYADFDGTYDADADAGSANYRHVGEFIHRYEPHADDWSPGDPTWQDGKGKNIIGALNYLASKGMNSVYFVTYNIDGGDGRDTWVWTSSDVRDRFDVSKLAQWEIVFRHMDRLGMLLHVVTQETENDQRLGGDSSLNPIRKLYLRELVARFAHHPAVVWNLGEESDLPGIHLRQISSYIRETDPYDHPITVHTHARMANCYRCIIGEPTFEVTSIQGRMEDANGEAIRLRRWSAEMARPWAIFHDEQNPATVGVKPDSVDPDHDKPRKLELWGNLMGGGSGVEWYFGSDYDHMDINAEDWRSRDLMWDQTRYALEFFRRHLPFPRMQPDNDLASGAPAYVFAEPGREVVAVYLREGGEAELALPAGTYRVRWYDPRNGGELQTGSAMSITSSGEETPVAIGRPPSEPNQDWAALITRE